MDALFIAVAFFFGMLAQQFGLPPLVGFLISGFVLHAPMICPCILRANGSLSLEWDGSGSPPTTFLKIASLNALSVSIVTPRRLNCIEAPTATSCWQTRRIPISGNACNSRTGVILAMPKHSANLHAAQTLKRHGYGGVVAAIAKFDDEVKELQALGVDTAFDLYSEAGAGFADHVCNVFNQQRPELVRILRKEIEQFGKVLG